MTLAELDSKEIAVLLTIGDRCRVHRGTGLYKRDRNEAGSLQIAIHDADKLGCSAIILDEEAWNGRIISGIRYDCDYGVEIQANAPET